MHRTPVQPMIRSRSRRLIAATILLVVCLSTGMWSRFATAETAIGPPHKALVEAAFVAKFPIYVTWPDEKWKKNGRVVIGVIGQSDVLPHLRRIAAEGQGEGIPIQVEQIDTIDDVDRCNVLFISGSEDKRLEKILDRIRTRPILTVGNTRGFAERGVHINLYTQDNHIRFEINKASSASAGLAMSFRLLDLAKVVE